MSITPRELFWADMEDLGAGALVNLMLANFNPHVVKDSDVEPYNQNSTYYAAAEALDRRFPAPSEGK